MIPKVNKAILNDKTYDNNVIDINHSFHLKYNLLIFIVIHS